ncbi:UNVERIFIED_CONTAM: putative linoleate 9S-lipoxygenase 5 [Sesamum latifolium]|uniref:Linoleate 9S-lipoxygenase 5 n=1 Tax=Sesamum latifolium TaxID=2727402 RepID=A0AAW2XT40_9LAMI
MLEKLLGSVCGKTRDEPKIQGRVVLMKKNVMDVTDVGASVVDRLHELFGKGVSFQLISAEKTDLAFFYIFYLCFFGIIHSKWKRGKLGKEAYLENWVSKFTSLTAEAEATFDVSFHWDESLGVPGAFIVRNHHHSQFYLKTVTLEDVPGHGQVHFVCNSWVYPTHRYKYDRVFFTNKAYLPSDTPEPLRFIEKKS